MKKLFLICSVIAVLTSCQKADPKPDPQPEPAPDTDLKITEFSPDYGKTGTEITLKGTGFSTDKSKNAVSLDGKVTEIVSVSATEIKIKAPAEASHGKIEVKVGTKSATTSANFFYEPQITEVKPTEGKIGDEVTITGAHFLSSTSDMEVKFNGTPGVISEASATTIKVKVPTGSTTGKITVNHKGRAVVEGPEFKIIADENPSELIKVVTGNIEASKLYSSGMVFIVDDVRDKLYALSADRKKIVKIDLNTNSETTLVADQSPFLLGNIAAPFYPSAMALSADGETLWVLCTTNNNVETQSNVFEINTSNGAFKAVGNRKIGTALGGLTGGGANMPFWVDEQKNIFTSHYDGSVMTYPGLAKFTPDLSSFTRVLGLEFGASNRLVRIDDKTFRAIFGISPLPVQYVDISGGNVGAKTSLPAAAKADQLGRAGVGKYATVVRTTNGYSIHSLNDTWLSRTDIGTIAMEITEPVANKRFSYHIDRLYGDSKGNLYLGVNLNVEGNSSISEHSGIYKITVR